jgi:hypothetical protein
MRRAGTGSTFVASLVLAVTAGCGTAPVVPTAIPPVPSPSAPSTTPAVPSTEPSPPAETPTPTESLTEDLTTASFSADSILIDNPWLPLTPGTRWVYEGDATIDDQRIKRRVVFYATDLAKVIGTIRTRVMYELDYDEGDLVEAELVFIAQADDGAVWQLGQYPEEYEDGTFVDAPAWIHGYEGALAGIWIQAEPGPGLSYAQGWGPAVGWTDRAKVFEMGSKTCVPAGCYEDVLVIDEFNPEEPDAHQLKYYARDVGSVRVGWAGAREEEQEVLQLTEVVEIGPDELAKIRADVLAIEKRAYEFSKDVYALTPPAEQATGGG